MTPVKQYKWFGEEIKPEHDIHDIRLDSAKLYFEDEKKKEHKVTFEQNLIANFWFLDQWLNEQKKSQ